MWKRNGSIEDGTDFFLHPKYSIIAYQFSLASRHVRLNFNTTSLAEEEIWVLLTRHVVQTSRNLDFIALRIEIEDNILPAVLPMNQLNSLSTVSSIELYNFVDSNYLSRGRTRTVRTSWWVMQNYIFPVVLDEAPNRDGFVFQAHNGQAPYRYWGLTTAMQWRSVSRYPLTRIRRWTSHGTRTSPILHIRKR